MSSGPNGQPAYRVVFSGLVQQEINNLIAEADSDGSGAEVRQALATVLHRLENDPFRFGELKGTLPSLNLTMHVAPIRPLVVHFGIHRQLRIVFVKTIYRI